MMDRIVSAVFLISAVALIAINADGVTSFVKNGFSTYAKTVGGLQGRRV